MRYWRVCFLATALALLCGYGRGDVARDVRDTAMAGRWMTAPSRRRPPSPTFPPIRMQNARPSSNDCLNARQPAAAPARIAAVTVIGRRAFAGQSARSLAPAFGHRRQLRRPSRKIRARSPVAGGRAKASCASSVDIEARRDLDPGILKDICAAPPAPAHHGVVAQPQQRRDLRTKQRDDRADPAVEQNRPIGGAEGKAVEHPNDVVGAVPGLAGDPAIGREQPDRLAARIERDRDKMADLVAGAVLERRRLRRRSAAHRRTRSRAGRAGRPRRHPLGAQKGVEMPVLAAERCRHRVGVIEILGMALRVVDVARGIVPPIGESLAAGGDRPEDAAPAGSECAAAFGDDGRPPRCRRAVSAGVTCSSGILLGAVTQPPHANETWPQ